MPRTLEQKRTYQREYKRKVRALLGKKERKKIRPKKTVEKELLEKLYVIEKKSIREIARILGFYTGTVSKRLKEYNIPIRENKIVAGQKYGKLTVLFNKGKRNCLCQCDCGKKLNIRRDNLKKLAKQSCKKCAKADAIKFYGNITKQYWRQINRNALKRNIEFTISPEYTDKLFTGFCVLTNLQIGFATSAYGFYLGENTASLDRINNTKGYIEGNVRWIHKDINWMKQDFTEEEFINYCCLIAKNIRKNEINLSQKF